MYLNLIETWSYFVFNEKNVIHVTGLFMSRIAKFVVLASLASISTNSLANEAWNVLPEHATCMLSNLEAYISSKSEPVVIFLQVCPTVDRQEALSKLQQNSGVTPHVKTLPNGKAFDEIIVYTREELACLRTSSFNVSQSPVLLPRKPCVR